MIISTGDDLFYMIISTIEFVIVCQDCDFISRCGDMMNALRTAENHIQDKDGLYRIHKVEIAEVTIVKEEVS